MGEQEPTKLHFTRVRSKGDSSFYDPQSDIRVVLPTAAKMTLDVLMQVTKDDWVKREFSYLAKCYAIYQIRLAEDSTNLVQQEVEFSQAIQKASPRAKMLWMHTMFILLNAVYGLFTRRDTKTDGAAIRGMLNTAQQAALLSVVSPEQATEIINKFREQGELLTSTSTASQFASRTTKSSRTSNSWRMSSSTTPVRMTGTACPRPVTITSSVQTLTSWTIRARWQ